jgi:hypothetical protein
MQQVYSNRVTSPDEYRTFRQLVLHLGSLQQRGHLFINDLDFGQAVLDRVRQQPSTSDIVSALAGGLAWNQNSDGTFTLSRAVRGRVLISNYDPRNLSNIERERLNEIASSRPDNFVLIDVRPNHPGGDFPIFGTLKLRSLFAMLDFVGKSIHLFPEFAVDPDPRTDVEVCGPADEQPLSEPRAEPRICVRNPVQTLAIQVSNSPPPTNNPSIGFDDQYYTIGDTRWDRATFVILYELFQVTVTDVSRVGIPITISK